MSSKKVKSYLASPLGFSEVGRLFYYGEFVPMVERVGFEILDPWKLTDQRLIDEVADMPEGKERRLAWQKLDVILGENNCKKGIEPSHIVIAILDGTDVDSGTASEIGYAAALGKAIMGYRGDFRLSADNEGSTVNLQVEYFIRKTGGTICTKMDDLEIELKNIYIKLSTNN